MAKKPAKKSGRKSVVRGRKPKAISLHLGLNLVDPAHYEGWDGPLSACELDAHDTQTPNFFVLGPAGRFVRQAPFRV